ncbi:ABC transporter substrate-binding protein [Halostagnicola sp. A56]|uniref:thiamine ABC transporter substrate-binding protein n=1 Tax=Halostagnicola sp. A56 TaxID=1495067 RepID=UPI0004A028CD|nr:thiamine ABC transporter substrate-binding protein [Halostagnicola sp. A56]KDE59730.1 ABC transporter substrate-binding protein [Halostagnicola sp. A56]
MQRRSFVRAAGMGAVTAGLAGCLTRENGGNGDGDGDGDGQLEIASYTSFVEGNFEDAPSPAEWLTEAFEDEYPDTELKWTVPENGINRYVRDAKQGNEIGPDVYLGLNVDDLVRIDETFGGQLFDPIDRDELENVDRVRDDIDFGDPDDRVIPYDTGYISLVYDESAVETPKTLDQLLESEYESEFVVQNAQRSDPGRAFLLWTIDMYGEDGYLEYWEDLQANDTLIGDSWTDTYYGPYDNEERSVIVSYSTDQVFYAGGDLTRHQVAFLDGKGYENHEGMAVFADSGNAELAHEFMDFALTGEAQAAIAEKNVQFPAVADEHVDLGEDFYDHALEPDESITFTYDELEGNLSGWVDEWGRTIAQ